MNTNRKGFTLVELLIVVVLASVVMGVLYQTIYTQSRAYRQADARIAVQQLTRTAVEALGFEFRELSATASANEGDSDIAAMDQTWIVVRAMRKMGITCLGAPGGTMTIYQLGEPFLAGDSLLIYAENEPQLASDDGWLRAHVDGVQSGAPGCNDWDGYPRYRLQVSAPTSAGTVLEGAPIRAFEWLRYEVVEVGGQWVLARRRGATVHPLIGPLADRSAIRFRYFNASGVETNQPSQVSRIQITARGVSNLGIDGVIGDTITTQVNLRNNRRF